MTDSASPLTDLIDDVLSLAPGHAVHGLRHQRAKVVAALQASHQALFGADLAGLSLAERLLVALHACRLSRSEALAARYRGRLVELGCDTTLVDAVDAGTPLPVLPDERLASILDFSGQLVAKPQEGERAALESLAAAGLGTAAVVALAQLVSFLACQIRVVAGLQALAAAGSEPVAERAADTAPAETNPQRSGPVRINGFTDEPLSWLPWLEGVDLAGATPAQRAALDETGPAAGTSPFFLLLAQQPEILRLRSNAFNAALFAPGGMPRAERELAATAVSVANACVYCASLHAQRYEQLARRSEAIEQLFHDPQSAGVGAREQAIVAFSLVLGPAPESLGAAHVSALLQAGLSPLEMHDLVHAVAVMAWANRLALNLGEVAASA